ncbi:putative oxidoreductase [Polaromonas sp. OV174]|uniref:DoxX family protein n=1 Tax=Polaromonas sp. OV174 TaxID=1855300 RepID=UPI0008F05D11|nr:DoxX family protein [Polaromonas sp. OV174]SFB83809.1 putative oxidoreductase [Polaromonas sp. OV174]
MASSIPTSSSSSRLIIPALGKLYDGLHDISFALLRVMAGVALAIHGWPKIQDPMKLVGMVESLGFAPGPLWAVLLAATEFIGGILLALGLLTRPAALATTIVLLVTVYFHWIVKSQGYDGAEKSLLWAAMTFLILVRGAGAHSIDRLLKKVF